MYSGQITRRVRGPPLGDARSGRPSVVVAEERIAALEAKLGELSETLAVRDARIDELEPTAGRGPAGRQAAIGPFSKGDRWNSPTQRQSACPSGK